MAYTAYIWYAGYAQYIKHAKYTGYEMIYRIWYTIYSILPIYNTQYTRYTFYTTQNIQYILDIPIQGIGRLYSIYYTVGYRGSHHFTVKSLWQGLGYSGDSTAKVLTKFCTPKW